MKINIISDRNFKPNKLSPKVNAEKALSSPGKYCTGTSEAKEKLSVHTTGYLKMSQKKFANDPFGLNDDRSLVTGSNLCFLLPSTGPSKLISPNIKRPASAMDMKISHLSVEEIGEQYWGENLNYIIILLLPMP